MRFQDIKNVSDMINYCKQNNRWSYTHPSPNPLEIELVFYYYQTPLLLVNTGGDIYYMCDYTKEYYISAMTCWFLSKCKGKFYPIHRDNFKYIIVDRLKLESGKL